MKTSKGVSLVTLVTLRDKSNPSFDKRDQGRDVARVLRSAAAKRGGKVTIKQDVKDSQGRWSYAVQHNDGRGVLRLSK